MVKLAHKILWVIAIVSVVTVFAVLSTGLVSLSLSNRMIIVLGLLTGASYALLALGFTLSYGVAEVVNMAHGAFFMVGTYAFLTFSSLSFFPLDPLYALFLAIIFMSIVGAVIYLVTIHPIIKDPGAMLVVTVGVALILQQVILIQFGSKHWAIPTLLSGNTYFWGVTISYPRILAFAVSMALFLGITIFIAKTRIGAAMKAVAQDREMGMLMGINTTRLYILTMGISAALATVAGVLIVGSVGRVAQPHMWLHPLAISFAIVILGGLGSIKGTFVGAFFVGFVETAVTIIIPEGAFLKGAVALGIMVAILLIKPKGLFGKHIELEE